MTDISGELIQNEARKQQATTDCFPFDLGIDAIDITCRKFSQNTAENSAISDLSLTENTDIPTETLSAITETLTDSTDITSEIAEFTSKVIETTGSEIAEASSTIVETVTEIVSGILS